MTSPRSATRRRLMGTGLAVGAWLTVCPGAAETDDLAAAIHTYTGGVEPKPGRVKLDVSNLVDNGNTVPITVSLDSPMTAAHHVKAIAVFNEKNPQRDVARFAFTPLSGRATASTRIRLATSQKLVAVAQLSDGSFWSDTVNVVVTLAACIEGEP